MLSKRALLGGIASAVTPAHLKELNGTLFSGVWDAGSNLLSQRQEPKYEHLDCCTAEKLVFLHLKTTFSISMNPASTKFFFLGQVKGLDQHNIVVARWQKYFLLLLPFPKPTHPHVHAHGYLELTKTVTWHCSLGCVVFNTARAGGDSGGVLAMAVL